MALSCLVTPNHIPQAPVNVFNFQTYNFLRKANINLEDEGKRKRQSLILKSRSVSSLSGGHHVHNVSGSKEKSVKVNKMPSGSKIRIDSGKVTPGNISQKSIFQSGSAKSKAVPYQAPHNNPGSSSFHFMGGFLTRPKEKSGFSKLEKEMNSVIESLQHMRKEIASLKQGGTKISVQETTKEVGTTKVILTHPKHHMSKSRSISPKLEKNFESRIANDRHAKKNSVSKTSSGNLQNTESTESGNHTRYQGIVKTLLGQLVHNTPSSKESSLSIEDFVKSLMPKPKPVDKHMANQNASVGDSPHEHASKKVNTLLAEFTQRLFELATVQNKAQKPQTVEKQESKGVQTEEQPKQTIHFSNINLSKTIEELIKKVIVESPLVKYNPNNLTDYFEKLVMSDRNNKREISDMQKQALFVSIYSLLQRQLLVEVTLEMIKDSGVKVQNLFQYTFSRIGLDYDKYVQYENTRDQDLSSRPIFEGDLDCSLEIEEPSERSMLLNRYTTMGNFNYFPLDFNKIQQTLTHEQATEKTEQANSTKR